MARTGRRAAAGTGTGTGTGAGQGWGRARGMEPRGLVPAGRDPRAPGGGRPPRGVAGAGTPVPRTVAPHRSAPLHPVRPRRQGDRRACGRSPAPAPARDLHGTGTRTGSRTGALHPRQRGRHAGTGTGTASSTRACTTRTGTLTQVPAPGFGSRGGTLTPHGTGYRHRQRGGNGAGPQQADLTRYAGTRSGGRRHALSDIPPLGPRGTPRSPAGPCCHTRCGAVAPTRACAATVTAAAVSEEEALPVHVALHPASPPPQPCVTACHPPGARGAAKGAAVCGGVQVPG